MRRTKLMWSVIPAATALASLLLTAGCGDVEVESKPDDTDKAAEPTKVDTSAGESNWLLGLTTAGGADAETSTTVYITYNPSTGQAKTRKLPGVQAASASPEQAALLVSADRRWAIPDTGISRGEERSGRLKVYSLADGTAKVVDIRDRTGKDDVNPIGWAFDPERSDTLRVVDTKNRVWAVNVAGGDATAEPSLPNGPWEFTNGFNTNTGEPWVESIESDATRPPGNLPVGKDPVTRNGGTVLPAGTPALAELPASPCKLGAGYTDDAGVTWAFCADTASLATYYLPEDGKEWTAYGKPSTPVTPEAAGFPLVFPPAE